MKKLWAVFKKNSKTFGKYVFADAYVNKLNAQACERLIKQYEGGWTKIEKYFTSQKEPLMYLAILTLLNGDLYKVKVFTRYKQAMAWAKWVTKIDEKSRVGNIKVNIIKAEVEDEA